MIKKHGSVIGTEDQKNMVSSAESLLENTDFLAMHALVFLSAFLLVHTCMAKTSNSLSNTVTAAEWWNDACICRFLR